MRSWLATGLPSAVFQPRRFQDGIHLEKTAAARRGVSAVACRRVWSARRLARLTGDGVLRIAADRQRQFWMRVRLEDARDGLRESRVERSGQVQRASA